MMITLPCSSYHLPMQTARAHGSHFQMGSLSPRKPIIHRSGANLQVLRRTSLDRRNFVVYPSADRPDPVRTTGGPPHALRGPFPRNTVDASRATPPTELLDRATGAGRATSCPTLPRRQSTPLRLSAGATPRSTRPLPTPTMNGLSPESRCLDYSHNPLHSQIRHPPVCECPRSTGIAHPRDPSGSQMTRMPGRKQ
jgi:hypothetical protein